MSSAYTFLGNWPCLISLKMKLFLVFWKLWIMRRTCRIGVCVWYGRTIMWLVLVFFLVNYELDTLFILEVWKLWWIWCWYSWFNCIRMLVILWVNACMQNDGDVDGEFCCWTCA